MALLTTFSDSNKVTDSLLSVRYTVTYEQWQVGYFRCVRTGTKRYSYIGMTLAAANLCKAAKIAQYTYNVCRIDGKSSPSGLVLMLVKECVANVSVVHAENDSWRCDIDVNESDVLISFSRPDDVAGMFAQYVNTRNYDEDNQLIIVTNVVYNQASGIPYSISFTGVQITSRNYYDFIVEFKENSSIMNWTSYVVVAYSEGTIHFQGPATFSTGNLFRIRYKNFVSNVWVKGE